MITLSKINIVYVLITKEQYFGFFISTGTF